ncbi:histidine-rich glycoprotein [Patagioenas fasciata]|uniref:histidine-rich glycoprotein n=1 Tax=Patagioenas fasciata TaxID=372321 RepID=UPI0032E86E4D
MLLLASALFLTLLQGSNALNKTNVTPADCNTIETDAGVALDLVNRHRRDGYVFGLFRVADAHKLHIGNSSVLYLTLDVLETECPVLSRRHWESCEYGEIYSTDFGQCKIITYTSQLLKKPQLYGFNCTLSPVPPDLLECKDCPVKVEVLEVTEQHKNIAAKALKKFNSESNHTNYFDVDKVEKILKTTASREGHILGFSIKETNCSKSTQQAKQALQCDFLDDWHAHVGFCKARVISDTEEPDGTDISCELYSPRQHDYGKRCRHPTPGQPCKEPHPHHHFGHKHHHRHHHKHGCPSSSQSGPEDPEHNHSFNKQHQDSHEGSAPPPHHSGPHHHFHPPHHCPPPPPHCGPYHHPPPPPPHDGTHPPPQEEPQHPPSAPPPHDEPHDPPSNSQEESHHLPSPPLDDDQHSPPLGPRHGPHCPPPHHRPHHHHPPPHHGPHGPPRHSHGPHQHFHPPHHCPPPPPHCGPHHHPPPPPHDGTHPPPQEETQHPPSAPPPHDEPHDPSPSQEELHHPSPPPPEHDQHSPPLGPHHGPHCPPAPHGPHHHHPPPHHGPHHHHPPPHHGPHGPPRPPHGPHQHFHPPHHCPPPPPHCGPHHHPPPPPHDRTHPPPQEETQHPPSAPPPPPHGPHHHHPPPHHGPHHHHPPPHCGPHHPPPPRHLSHLYHHYYRHHHNKTRISGKYFPFQIRGNVYRIPVQNQQDPLPPPTANFPELYQSSPHSASAGEDIPFLGSNLKEMAEALGFPDHHTQSKSCPGKPRLTFPKILPLFPHSSMAEDSPI